MSASKFDRMIALEHSIKHEEIVTAMGMYSWDRERGARSAAKHKAELYKLVDSLSVDELVEYGRHRQIGATS